MDFWKNLNRLLQKKGFKNRVPTSRPYSQTGPGLYSSILGRNQIALSIYEQNLEANIDRITRLRDYNLMDTTPIPSAALNIYADDSCSYNEDGNVLKISSQNERITRELERLFYEKLNIEFNIYHWIRTLCKFGDGFELLAIEPKKGIQGSISLPTEEIEREEAFDGDPNSVRFRWVQQVGESYKDYEVAHFRLMGDDNYLPYGRSILESGRRSWKQLQLLEDAMLIYRVSRASEKRAWYIETGNLPPDQVPNYLEQQRAKIKTEDIINPQTGEIDLRYRSASITEDFWLAKRGDVGSRVEVLQGGCFALDTKIPLLDGRTLKLQEIIDEFKINKNLWAYSCNPKTGEFAPGKITNAAITGRNKQVLKITLDNQEELILTPEHKIPTQNKGIIEAKDLTIHDNLWPFRKEFKSLYGDDQDKNLYEFIYDSSKKDLIPTHRLVTNYMKNINKQKDYIFNDEFKDDFKKVRHHKDFNRLNNNPDNLVFMSWRDHWSLHSKHFPKLGNDAQKKLWENDKEWANARRKNLSENSKKMWENEEYRNKMSIKLSSALKNCIKNLPEEKREYWNIKRGQNARKAIAALYKKMNDSPEFKKDFYEKAGKTGSFTKKNNKTVNDKIIENNQKMWKNEEYRNKMILQNSTRWKNPEFRKRVSQSISKGKSYKYDKIIEKYLIEAYKNGCDDRYKLETYFQNNSEFKDYFFKLNPHAKSFNTGLALKKLGYNGYRDFYNKANYFNHKIIKIEWLENKIDVGTLTIDGDHEFHDFHNFALDCGIYANNSRLNDIEDVEYVKQQLITSLGVPKMYLQFDEDMSSKSSASKEDIRFARTIQRIQKIIVSELTKIAMIHLYSLQKYDMKDLIDFDISLYNPSTIMELGKLELIEKRLDIFQKANETNAYSEEKAKLEILHLSETEIKEDRKKMVAGKKFYAKLQKISEGEEEQPTNTNNPNSAIDTGGYDDESSGNDLAKEFDDELKLDTPIGQNNTIKQNDKKEFSIEKGDLKIENSKIDFYNRLKPKLKIGDIL